MYKIYTKNAFPPLGYKSRLLLIMKLTIILLTTFIFQVNASSFAQKVTYSKKGASLTEVFKEIRKQTGYYILWSSNKIRNTKPVDVNFKNTPIEEVLTQSLKDQPLTYTIQETTVLIKEKIVTVNNLNVKPPAEIKGKVTDIQGQPLPGVTVKLQGTTTGVVTNADGIFSINLPDDSGVLVFSFIGFKTKEVVITGRTDISVVLEETVSILNEVVVTGYSSQLRETVTTAVSKLDNKVLENVPYANVALALQGSIAGVRVQSTSGQPGAAPRVIVRGGTSINNPQGAIPLYIVDGVIRSDLDNISSDDIESIQVLKDAAATSIYGARGSNGVVLVKTKSGKPGPTRVSYKYDVSSSNSLQDFEFISGRDYLTAVRSSVRGVGRVLVPGTGAEVTLLTEARAYGIGNDFTKNTQATPMYLTPANQHKLNEGWESMIDPVDPTKTIIFKSTDFSKTVFQTGVSHNHHVSVSGGTERSTFNAGVGYMYAQGTIKNTDFDRLTMNLNGNIKARDNLSFFASMNYAGSGDNANRNISSNIGAIALRYAALAPTNKYKYEDGELAHGRDATIGNADYYFPLADVKGDELKKQKLTLSLGSHWEILPGFSFDPQVSMYNQEYRTDLFMPAYWQGVNIRSQITSRNASATQGSYRQQQADALFNYKKQFAGKHNLSAVAGFTYFGRDTTTLVANGRAAATDNITTLNASSTPVSVSSGIFQRKIMSYLYGINYDYQQKYLLTLNGRYDGASNLGENKWGFFPGVSVGWNMHQERFWKALPSGISSLKLRGSYGENGNISGLGDYDTQGTYTTGAIYLGASAIQNSLFPNQNLTWEESKTLNFGADIGLFNNRVNILFDIFRRVTDNLLTNLSLPPSTGFGTIRTNYGSLEGKGVELELTAQVLPSSSAFKWQTSFNTAQIKNKILKLPPSGVANNRVGGELIWVSGSGATAVYEYRGGLQEGGRIGDFYAYKQIGIYATDAEAASAPVDMLNGARNNPNGRAAGGDVKWQDTDGNGTIDAKDKVYVGNPYPVWTGGFNNYFGYKNFNLSVRMDYATGHTTYNEYQRQFNANATGDSSPTKEFWEKSWKQQGDITDVPRYNYLDTKANFGRLNSTYYTKGDYLSLREVTLSYTIPVKVMQKMKMNSLRLNLSGYNLHYFTRPNSNGVTRNNIEDGGTDAGRYALSRDFIFGANLTF